MILVLGFWTRFLLKFEKFRIVVYADMGAIQNRHDTYAMFKSHFCSVNVIFQYKSSIITSLYNNAIIFHY